MCNGAFCSRSIEEDDYGAETKEVILLWPDSIMTFYVSDSKVLMFNGIFTL